MATYTKRQQKAHRKAWVKALRSGRYKQARGQLYKPASGGMCCLGVACDLSKLGKWNGEFYLGEDASLPEEVRQWLGLVGDTGGFVSGTSLSSKNDAGASFKQIAKIIEAEPDGLVAK